MALQRPAIGHTVTKQHCSQQPEGHISDGQHGPRQPGDVLWIPVLKI